jgi:hypothetical protein
MKAINYVLLLIGMIGFTTCYSQTNTNNPPVKIWDKTFGGSKFDWIQSITNTKDGGYILIGYSASDKSGDKSENSNEQNYDYWIIKINKKGQKIWDKTFGDSNEDQPKDIIETQDGGFIIVGIGNSTISGGPIYDKHYGWNYWVIKIDNNGKKIWDKTFGGDLNDFPVSIIATTNGDFIIAGYSSSNISGEKTESHIGYKELSDYWIVKINGNGEKIWDKTFGGKKDEEAKDIIATQDGGFIIVGNSRPFMYDDGSNDYKGNWNTRWDYWIVKINADGQKEWDKTFGGDSDDIVTSVVATKDGKFVIAGASYSMSSNDKSKDRKGETDYWILKIDINGNKIWDKTFGGEGADYSGTMICTHDNGIIILGTSDSNNHYDKTNLNKGKQDFWILKIDDTGKKVWDITIGGVRDEVARSIIATEDEGFIVTGSSNSKMSFDKSDDSKGDYDYWLVKLGFQ